MTPEELAEHEARIRADERARVLAAVVARLNGLADAYTHEETSRLLRWVTGQLNDLPDGDTALRDLLAREREAGRKEGEARCTAMHLTPERIADARAQGAREALASLADAPAKPDGICMEFGIESRPDSAPRRRPNRLKWNGHEWVDYRCGCRYHPDDDNGTHGGGPHVHACEVHDQADTLRAAAAAEWDAAVERFNTVADRLNRGRADAWDAVRAGEALIDARAAGLRAAAGEGGMSGLPAMTDAETAEYIRKGVANRSGHPSFGWPTDGCGYEQHIRFVTHRNKNWAGETQEDWRAFVLAYADSLDLPATDESAAEDRSAPPPGWSTDFGRLGGRETEPIRWSCDFITEGFPHETEATAIADAWACLDAHASHPAVAELARISAVEDGDERVDRETWMRAAKYWHDSYVRQEADLARAKAELNEAHAIVGGDTSDTRELRAERDEARALLERCEPVVEERLLNGIKAVGLTADEYRARRTLLTDIHRITKGAAGAAEGTEP